jgi:hypothetical protein
MVMVSKFRFIIFVFVLTILTSLITIGCSTYSTTRRAASENIINAPVDVVWAKTLEILPDERMTIKNINKADYFIEAKKAMTFWSYGDEVGVRLIPRGEKQTEMQFNAGMVWGGGDFGHEGRMVNDIFNRIKNASESAAANETK